MAAGPVRSVYIVWQEATLAPSGSAIALSKSLDGGLTWSEPTRVNTVPTTQAFTPSIEVAPNGTLGVTQYDFRSNTPGQRCHAANRLLVPAIWRQWRDVGRITGDPTAIRHA